MQSQFDSLYRHEPFSVYTIKTGRWRQNSYLIFNQKTLEIFLIDPGGEFGKISKLIQDLKARPSAVLLTHAHHDHVGALNEVCQNFEVPYFMDKADEKLLKRAPLFAYSFEMGRSVVTPKRAPIFFSNAGSQLEQFQFKILPTPGHTEGGVVIFFDQFAFTGDTLLNKMIGRTDLPGSCTEKLHDSIEFFLNEADENSTLFPGHGEPWLVKDARAWWQEHKHNVPEYRTEDESKPY